MSSRSAHNPNRGDCSVTFVELQAPSQEECVTDANGNSFGDVVDIVATASELRCHAYLPLAVAQWGQPWSTPTPCVEQLPIHLVYANHVEVESVIDERPPLVDGATYTTTPERYASTSGQLEWEMAQAEAAEARISLAECWRRAALSR